MAFDRELEELLLGLLRQLVVCLEALGSHAEVGHVEVDCPTCQKPQEFPVFVADLDR